jgi:hypothetical protein
MKHLPPSRLRLAILAAAFVLAAPAAHAFTFEGQANTNTNSDGSARYTDPDERFSNSGNGQGTIQQGNTTLRFGQPQSFDQRYDPNRMFNPVDRPNSER